MKHRLAIADSVAKQLTDEMNVPKAQIASMETTSRKIIDDLRSEVCIERRTPTKKDGVRCFRRSRTPLES